MAEADEERTRRQAEVRGSEAHIARLDAEALAREEHIAELDARALARDEQIVELVREIDQLNTRAESAATIEQAKSVVMSTMHCSADAAFAVLVAQSQRENRKLREIAAELARLQDRT